MHWILLVVRYLLQIQSSSVFDVCCWHRFPGRSSLQSLPWSHAGQPHIRSTEVYRNLGFGGKPLRVPEWNQSSLKSSRDEHWDELTLDVVDQWGTGLDRTRVRVGFLPKWELKGTSLLSGGLLWLLRKRVKLLGWFRRNHFLIFVSF